MLNAIRNASANWLGRLVLTVIMGVLIVSFAIWGIGDIFRGGVNRTVATVGSEKISADEIRNAFSTELQRVQRQLRRVVTAEDARAFGLDRELLNRAIDEAALDATTRALGLAMEPALVARAITEAPEFKTNGVFDRERLNDALRQSGYNEQTFLSKQRDLMLRLQLLQGLAGGLPAPAALGQALHQYRAEERDLDVVVIPVDKVPAAAEPDDAALQAFYDERKSEFRTTETRKATLIRIAPTDFAGGLTVTEADLRAFYTRLVPTGRFGPPEKRQIQRVLFDTEADAKAASARLAGGLGFEALLAERKLKPEDVDFGTKSAQELADAAIREAVFALAEGAVSAPVKDPFGWVLLRVGKIEPARIQPFELMKAGLEPEVRAEMLRTDNTIRGKMDGLHRKIEDQRNAGKSLAEAASAAGIQTITLPALDRQGGDGAGGRVAVPGGAEVQNAIFASDIGLDNEPIHTADGGYVWFEINAVEPAREKAFDEVKAEARTRYLADRRGKALAEFVTTQLKRLDEGAKLAAVAQELGLQVQQIRAIKRSSRDAILGQNGVERAFSGPVGKATGAVAGDGTSRLLIVPTNATMLPHDPALDEREGFSQRLAQGVIEDVMAQYTAQRRKDLGVSINQTLFNQAIGQTNN